jgi:hypothetical protein
MTNNDWNSPEANAYFQSVWEHAVKSAKKALSEAIRYQPLWDQLMKPELRAALEVHLDEVSFDRLETLALSTRLLENIAEEAAKDFYEAEEL